MNNSFTISESFTLPSNGLIYDTPINPHFTLRSMTTEDEMRRLAPTETPYKSMSDIIERCLVEKLSIPVYDLCIGDYQFMLHKLRIVTYGKMYKMTVKCPVCNGYSQLDYNLEDLTLLEYNEELKDLLKVELPQCKKTVELNLQTPRILDKIALRKKEIQKKSNGNFVDPSLILTLSYLIKTVDGQVLDESQTELFVRQLPMRDANILIQVADKINRGVGLDTVVKYTCSQCGFDADTTFRITGEFFGPAID